MNPFYDLNKRLTGIGAEPKTTLVETRTVAAKSPAKQTFEEALRTDLRSLMEDKSLSKAAKTVKKGALHKQEGIPKDKKIGDKKLNSLKKSGTPLEKKRANFALNIQGKGKKKVNEWGHDPRELSDPNSIWHQGGGDYDRDPDDQHAELVDAWYSEVEQAVKHRGIKFPISDEAIGDLTDIIAMDLDCSAGVVEDILVGMNDRHMHDNRHGNIDEADRGFRGVAGARDREDDERHDLDPSDWYIVIDGKLMKASVYPRQHAQARAEGFSPTREEARAKGGQQGVAEGDVEDFLARGGKIQQGEPTHKHTPRRKSSNSGDYTDFSMRRGERGIHGRGYGYDPDDHQSRNDELDYPTKDIRKPEYEGYERCAECAMGECDMHGEQPKDMNPRNKDWDDAAVARLRAQKNQRTAKRRVGQRDTGQPPVMPDLDESEDDILSYLKNKIAPANPKSRATSRPYNGRPGAADAHNGMEFEESTMKPDSIHWRDLQNYTGAVNIFTKSGRPVSYGRAVDGMYHGIPLTTFVIKDKLVVKKAMDKNTGDAMEEGMFPGSDEYDSKFGKPTADLDSAFSRGSSPAGGTVYTRKRKEVPFDSDEVEKPVASSDGPRKRGRPAGSKGGGGARLAGTHVPKHARSKEMDEDLDECPHCGQSMPGHGQGREIDLEAVKQGMGHFVNNVAPAARKAAGIAKVVGGAKSKVDYDGDGKKESGKAEHAGSVDKAIKANNSKSPAKPAAPAKGSNKPAAPAKGSDKPTKKAKEGDKPAKQTKEGAKPDFIDADKDGDKKEPMKKAFKDKKEKKVEETTTSGSVAPSAGGKSSGGMSVGKGIYDSWNRKYNTMLSESINITTNSAKGDDGEEDEHITIDVSGDDVARIKELLHSMGVGGDDGAEHMHGSQGMPLDFIEIDEAVGEEETPKPSAPVPPGPNGPWPAGSPQAAAYSKMSPEDQKFLGHANPLDPHILSRAPNGGKPVASNAGNGLSPEYQGKPAAAAPAAAAPAAAAPAAAAPAAAAKPAAPAAAGGLLALGSKGPEVVALQKLLGIEPADGDFGPQTKAAVMKKQKEIGAAVDGVWGPESKSKMTKVPNQSDAETNRLAAAGAAGPKTTMQTPPAATSQADKIARFKELLAKAKERPDSITAAMASDPNYDGGTYPGNPSTPPAPAAPATPPASNLTAQGFTESVSHFLNKMRLLEDLTPDEKKQLDDLYKELGNTEQPDPELSDLINQYNELFPSGSSAKQNATADDAMAQMPYDDPNRTADDAMAQRPYDDPNKTADDAMAQMPFDQSNSLQHEFGNANAVTKPEEIPTQADKKVPYWIKGKRYVYKTIRGTASWFPENIGTFAGAGPIETADNLANQQYTGSQADVPTSESIQRNSENQRLRELAGIAEAVAPVTKNAPDYPTNQVKADTRMMTQNLSGGLNGAKTTGQTTTPVVASQVKRLHSHVSEGQRMVDLYKTISAIENKEG